MGEAKRRGTFEERRAAAVNEQVEALVPGMKAFLAGKGVAIPEDATKEILIGLTTKAHLSPCPDCKVEGRVEVTCAEAEAKGIENALTHEASMPGVHELPEEWKKYAVDPSRHLHMHCQSCGSIGTCLGPNIIVQGRKMTLAFPETTRAPRRATGGVS